MEILIGKTPECDYRIENQFVSRRHCKLIFEAGHFFILDLDSMNGTFVEGTRISPGKKIPIRHGAEILLAGKERLDWQILGKLIPAYGKTARVPLDEETRRVSQRHNRASDNYEQAAHRPVQPPQPPQYYPPQPVQQQRPHAGLGNEMEYALHSAKSYVGAAFLTWFLYYIGLWIGGFIANVCFLSAAGKTKNIIGRNPPGIGCLRFLLFIHFTLPILLIVLLLIIGGGALSGFFHAISDFFQ